MPVSDDEPGVPVVSGPLVEVDDPPLPADDDPPPDPLPSLPQPETDPSARHANRDVRRASRADTLQG
jgi:hypothetical protein